MADSYSFSAEVLGAEELKKALSEAGNRAAQILADGLNKTAYTIQPAAVAKAPADTGQLRASIHTEPATADTMEARVGTNVKHAWPMETGSKPHPVDPRVLMNWAQRKLGNKNLAYPIAKAIARKGVQGRKYMIGAFEEKKEVFGQNMRQALETIMNIIIRG